MISKEEIFQKLRGIFSEMFALEPQRVSLSSTLYEDLDIDSIDAIDLLVRLEEITPKKLRPEDFKKIRTVGDVVDILHDLLQQGAVNTVAS